MLNPEVRYQVGQGVRAASVGLKAAKTRPPSRFTDGTLIDAMIGIDRYVTDPKDKEALREAKGIGTERTRNAIIENLIARNFVMRQKKNLISTPAGRSATAAIQGAVRPITDPVTTAKWEMALSSIEEGKLDYTAFMDRQKAFVTAMVETLRNGNPIWIDGAKRQGAEDLPGTGDACPKCKTGRLATKKVVNKASKAYGKLFLSCSDYPQCDFVRWPEDANNQKNNSKIKTIAGDGASCPECKDGIMRTKKVVNKDSKAYGKSFLSCSNYPTCKHSEWPK